MSIEKNCIVLEKRERRDQFFNEVEKLINNFLKRYGARNNRRHTYVSGTVFNNNVPGSLSWEAPKKYDTNPETRNKIGERLYNKVRDLLKKYNIHRVDFEEDCNDGYYYSIHCIIRDVKCIQTPKF